MVNTHNREKLTIIKYCITVKDITTTSTPLDQNLADNSEQEEAGTTIFFALMCVGIILVKHTDIIFIFVSLQL
jgi:hypothetical protein